MFPIKKQRVRFFFFILLVIFLVPVLWLFTSCTVTPVNKTFVSGSGHTIERRSGTCEQTIGVGAVTELQQYAALDPHHISLLDWNIYKEQRPGWEQDLVQVGGAKDIILLQEASLRPDLQRLLSEQGLVWNFISAFKYRNTESGVLTASSVPALFACGIRVEEPLLGLPKTMIVSEYRLVGIPETLLVANIHAINFTLGIRAYEAQLSTLYQVLQEHDGPVILAGDFNNWSENRSAVLAEFIEDLQLQPLSLSEKEDVRSQFLGSPVDHVFYRGMMPIQRQVHDVESSDHNPLAVTFRVDSSMYPVLAQEQRLFSGAAE